MRLQPSNMEKKNKNLIVLIIIAIIVLVVFLLWKYIPAYAPAGRQPAEETMPAAGEIIPKEDTSSAILNELQGLNVSDLNSEFQSIDAELNSL